MTRIRMILVAMLCAAAAPAAAQEAVPRIPLFAVDVRATFPRFPSTQALADSRGLNLNELPGLGIGVDVAANIYFFRWRAMTIGIGGEAMTSVAHQSPQNAIYVPTTERFRTVDAQLSLNFGSANGWSYLSGGIGGSYWSLIPDGGAATPQDDLARTTINFGGGARWFAKKHLALSVDGRFYALQDVPEPNGMYPASPKATMFIFGVGIAVK